MLRTAESLVRGHSRTAATTFEISCTMASTRVRMFETVPLRIFDGGSQINKTIVVPQAHTRKGQCTGIHQRSWWWRKKGNVGQIEIGRNAFRKRLERLRNLGPIVEGKVMKFLVFKKREQEFFL
jgi:hypothetical protein